MKKSIIYYTDNFINPELAETVREKIAQSGLEIYSASLEPLDFGHNSVIKLHRGYLAMFVQIVDCLSRSDSDVVFFCEHDVLYDPSHFDFTPERLDTYYYNNNAWKWNGKEAVSYNCRWLSQLCCGRIIALEHYRKKVELEAQGIKQRYEPGTRKGIDNIKTAYWNSAYPNIDIRHGKNLTGVKRMKLKEFRSKPKNFVRRDFVPGHGFIDINTGKE